MPHRFIEHPSFQTDYSADFRVRNRTSSQMHTYTQACTAPVYGFPRHYFLDRLHGRRGDSQRGSQTHTYTLACTAPMYGPLLMSLLTSAFRIALRENRRRPRYKTSGSGHKTHFNALPFGSTLVGHHDDTRLLTEDPFGVVASLRPDPLVVSPAVCLASVCLRRCPWPTRSRYLHASVGAPNRQRDVCSRARARERRDSVLHMICNHFHVHIITGGYVSAHYFMNILSKNRFLQNLHRSHCTSLYMICNHFHAHIITGGYVSANYFMNILSKNMFLQNLHLSHCTSLYMICNHFHAHIITGGYVSAPYFMNILSKNLFLQKSHRSHCTSLYMICKHFHVHIITGGYVSARYFMNILSKNVLLQNSSIKSLYLQIFQVFQIFRSQQEKFRLKNPLTKRTFNHFFRSAHYFMNISSCRLPILLLYVRSASIFMCISSQADTCLHTIS